MEPTDLGNGITYLIETIDASRASRYLGENKDNRKPSPSWVRTLAARQQRDEWMFTGDPIRFDRDGYLRDGQHRLSMVVQTGIPIEVPVIRGLDPNVFMVLDTGKRRELDTVLYILQYPNPHPLSVVIKEIWAYLGNLRPSGVSNDLFVRFMREHPEIEDSVNFYQERKGNEHVNLVGFSKPLTVSHYLLCRVDKEKGEDFITEIMFGRNPVTGAAVTGAASTLRTTLIKWARPMPQGKKAPDSAALFAIIQVWNQVQAGKESKAQVRYPKADRLKIPQSIIPRGFPKDLFFQPGRQLSLIDMEEAGEGEQENAEEATASNSTE